MKSRYQSVRTTDHQNAAVSNIANRYKISQYAATNRIFNIGLAIVVRSGNDLESAREIAIGGEINLAIPSDIQDKISFSNQITRRILAI